MQEGLTPLQPDRRTKWQAFLDRLSRRQEKLLLMLLISLYGFGGYFLIGLTTVAESARSLMTPADASTPFVPYFIWAYAWVYTAAYYPAFVIRDRQLFRRYCLALLMASTTAFVCFVVFPVSGIPLRPSMDGYDLHRFENWCMRFLFAYDPPFNLFPSLHMAIAAIATVAAWKARRLYGWLALGPAASVGLAIVLVKQHYLADGFAGFLLAMVCCRVSLQQWSPEPASEPAHDWRAPWQYILFHSLFYLAFYVAFRSGWQPWA